MIHKTDGYVKLLMKEWGLDKQHAKFQSEVEAVLMELCASTQLSLRNESRLQVEVIEGDHKPWAYFPIDESEVRTLRQVSEDEIRQILTIADDESDEAWEKFLDLNRRLILAGTAPGCRVQKDRVRVKPATRILLTLGSQMFNGRFCEEEGSGAIGFRDHLGHALLYLRDPEARNECIDADQEWKDCCQGS